MDASSHRINKGHFLNSFQESHHFPSIHPALHAHTPFEKSASFLGDGPWLGGTLLQFTRFCFEEFPKLLF